MKMHKSLIGVIKKYKLLIILLFLMTAVGYYFFNIIFLQNEQQILSVVILDTLEDTTVFESQLMKKLPPQKKEKITVKVLNPDVEANHVALTTWIRAKTVDLVIGQREDIEPYAQRDFFKPVDAEDLGISKENMFMCGLAVFDGKGNITEIGEEQAFGVCVSSVPGIEIPSPVMGIAINSPNSLNAQHIVKTFCD